MAVANSYTHLNPHPYTKGEEIWHAALHGVAAVAAIVGLAFLSIKAADHFNSLAPLAVGLFGGGMVIMFTCSTLYHSAYESPFQPFFKMLDHSAIYIMIATGYVPFALISLPKEIGIPITITVLSIAVVGVIFKLVMFLLARQNQFKWISLVLYLAMGWGGILLVKPLYTQLSPLGFTWFLAGGLAYTVGAGFYAAKKLKYSHAIWHFMVILGAFCHYVTVYWFII